MSNSDFFLNDLKNEKLNLEILGIRNIVLENISHSEITIINKIILSSNEYKSLKVKIEQASKLLQLLPKNQEIERLKQAQILNESRHRISKISQEAINIYQLLKELPQNSKKLKNASEAINNGNLELALHILNLKELEQEQKKLLSAKKIHDKERVTIRNKLKNNAREYLLRARLELFNFNNPVKSNEINELFESSIQSFPFFNNLFDFARFLQTQKKITLAEKIYKKALNNVRLNVHKSKIYSNLGNLYNTQNYKQKAIEYFKKAITYGEKASKKNYKHQIGTALTIDSLGTLYLEQHNYRRCELLFKNSLEIRKEFAKEPSKLYLPDLTSSLLNLARLYFRLGNFDNTNEYLLLAESNAEKYKEIHPYYYNVDCIKIYKLKGNLSLENEETEKARQNYQIAKKLIKNLIEYDYNMHIDKFIDIIIDFGNLCATEGHIKNSLRYYHCGLNIVKKLSQINPKIYIPEISKIEKIIGISYYKLKMFKDAIPHFKKALYVLENHSHKNSNNNMSELSMIYALLGFSYGQIDDFMESERNYISSISKRKELIKNNDNSSFFLLADVYFNLADLYKKQGDSPKAKEFCKLSMNLLEELSDDYRNLFLSDIASLLIKCADFYSSQNADELAIKYYDKALNCYETLIQTSSKFHLLDIAPIYFNKYVILDSKNLIEDAEISFLNLIYYLNMSLAIKDFPKKQLNELFNFLNFCIKYLDESGKTSKAKTIIENIQNSNSIKKQENINMERG